MIAIEGAAAALGVSAIHLMVRPENVAAARLYAAAGYESPNHAVQDAEASVTIRQHHLDGAPARLIDGDHPAPVPEVTVASRNVLGPLALTPE